MITASYTHVLRAFTLGVTLCISVIHCGGSGGTSTSNTGGTSNSGTTQLSDVHSWGYQLQDADPDDIAQSSYDLMVIDFSRDGSTAAAFSSDDVTSMKGSGDASKRLIAYMSIGEAEDYRDYFDPNADYIEAENPDWPGNYKVYYWQDNWQAVIDTYLDQIIDAGFDGVYLDIIDAYEYFSPDGDSGLDRISAADDMIQFVIHIAEYARAQNPDFIVIPQNGAYIIDDGSRADDYLEAIDAIGVEDTFYFGDDAENNPLDPQDDIVDILETYLAAEKVVLAIDYLTDHDLIDDFYTRAENAGYIPYSSVRDLDQLTINAGHEPE